MARLSSQTIMALHYIIWIFTVSILFASCEIITDQDIQFRLSRLESKLGFEPPTFQEGSGCIVLYFE